MLDDYEFGICYYFIRDFYVKVNFFCIDIYNEIFFNFIKNVFGVNVNLDVIFCWQGVEILLSKVFEKVVL